MLKESAGVVSDDERSATGSPPKGAFRNARPLFHAIGWIGGEDYCCGLTATPYRKASSNLSASSGVSLPCSSADRDSALAW